MTSFETINLDDYKKLVDNEKKIFDLTENSSIQNSSTTQNLKKSCKISRAQY